MIRNIIFDWSGTLVDDLPAVWQATNYVMRKAGIGEFSLQQFRAEFSLPFTAFYERVIPHVRLDQLEEWFHAHFREAEQSVIELPHARDFLIFCQEHGIRAFVLSTVHRDYFARQAQRLGFHTYVERPYVEVRDKRTKIGELLESNGLIPAETLFIGDMAHDIETAKHGGIYSCGVLTGYNNLDQLRLAQPDLIVEHLAELQGILARDQLEFRPAQVQETEGSQRQPIATVGALIFNDAQQVLMLRTHKWSDLWGIPGGKIKCGETSEAALRREIKEETNLDITDIRFVLFQDCIHSPEFYRKAHFILLNYTCRSLGETEVRLNEEAREFRWLSITQAFDLPLNQPTRTLLLAVNDAPKGESRG